MSRSCASKGRRSLSLAFWGRRRLSLAVAGRCGVTLVELVVAMAILSVIMTGVCEVFMAVDSGCRRGQSRQEALAAVSLANSRIADQIADATLVAVTTRFSTNDTLLLCMPKDVSSGTYTPVWSSGSLRYRNGPWVVLYLSDSTGSYYSSGTVLWAADFARYADFPSAITPDSDWTMNEGTSVPRVWPLASISFATRSLANGTLVTVTAVSSFRTGDTNDSVSALRTTCLRNETP
jgi:prepilin-type N-terminal cleavage/methylation domain-containing protein